MKPNTIKLFLTIFFLPLLSFGQQRWESIISDEDFAFVWNTLSYDGCQLITAATGGNGSNKGVIIKINKNGEELWRKILVYDNWNVPNGVKQYKNGTLIVYGTTDNDASVVMLDACGNLLWCSQYDESMSYKTDYTDAVFLDNGDIVLLMAIDFNDGVNWDVSLISFDPEGNLLWYHPFNLKQKYPRLNSMIYEWHLEKHLNFLMLSGFGYYTYPDHPNIGFLKPMFIKTDSAFNEEWLLPYGLTELSTEDTILGDARGVVSYGNGVLHGWGKSTKPIQSYYTSILMNFDTAGQETNCHIIENEMIDSTATENFFLDLCIRDDTTYFTSIKYGNQGWENPSGEVIMDTAGNVYQQQSHPDADLQGGFFPIAKDTVNNQYYLSYMSYDWDIVLYKFNSDLSDVPYDTTTYTYDSLCNSLPIISDTIYVTGCDVITAVPEFPSPQAYYKAKQTVELIAYPNPATETVNFKMKYTRYHDNMQLAVYDISGKLMLQQNIVTGEKQAGFDVSAFPPGMYVAVVSDNRKVLGRAVFSVVSPF